MSEKGFVESIQRSVKILHMDAFVWKTNDRFNLGIPDLVIIIDGKIYAIEAKFVDLAKTISTFKKKEPQSLPCLRHSFSGIQVGVLRQIARAGGCAMGAIGIPGGDAYIVHPRDIPKSGNFSYVELEELCIKVSKVKHVWRVQEWGSCLTKKRKSNQKQSVNQM